MKKTDLLYEGKAKKVYCTDVSDVLIVDYKDDATAFNGEKKGTIVGKGVVNNRMTNHVFQILEKEMCIRDSVSDDGWVYIPGERYFPGK